MTPEHHEGNGIKVSGAGMTIEAKGRYVAMAVTLLLVAVAGYVVYLQLTAIHHEIQGLNTQVARMACVLSIDPSQRDAARRYGDPCEWILLRWRQQQPG